MEVKQMNKWIGKIICAIVFVVCLILIIVGQRNIGLAGLGIMLMGLSGLITLLGYYNSTQK